MTKKFGILLSLIIMVSTLSSVSCGGGDDDTSSASDGGGQNTTGTLECRSDRDCASGLVCAAGKCVSDSSGLGEGEGEPIDGGEGEEDLCPVCDLPNATSHCDNPLVGCVIDECVNSYQDLDKDPSNGCEYTCQQTNNGIEICDLYDNDCNGEMDEVDVTRADTRQFWDAAGIKTDVNNCGKCGNICPTVANSTPKCVGGQCKIECNEGYSNNDQDVSNGCEFKVRDCYPTNGGVEICDDYDNDCDGIVNEAKREEDNTSICPIGTECKLTEAGLYECQKESGGGCTPDCADKDCGDNGCGGNCGYCYPDELCNANFECEPTSTCDRQCDEKTCGPDGCGGECGVCAGNEQCAAGQCASSFMAQDLQVNTSYTPAVISTRNLFLALRNGVDASAPLCSEAGENKSGKNTIYKDAETDPNWHDQGAPKYKYLEGHEDKIEWKTRSTSDGEYQIRIGLASRCLNEVPMMGCTEESDIASTAIVRVATRVVGYYCRKLTTVGEDVPVVRLKVTLGRIEVIPEANTVFYTNEAQAASDKKNCFVK